MAEEVRILGNDMDFLIAGEYLVCAKNVTITRQRNVKQKHNEASGSDEDHIATTGNWQLQATHLYSTTSENMAQINAFFDSREVVEVIIRRSDQQGYQFRGNVTVVGFQMQAGIEEPIGFNFACLGKGALITEEIFKVWVDENNDYLTDENGDYILI